MNLSEVRSRVQGRFYRTMNGLLFKNVLKMNNAIPYISFTFDDFPRSALHAGGKILRRHGILATYYASFGLMDTLGPTGRIFSREDIKELLAQGHELGCHTFGHCHAWEISPKRFEHSILENRRTLEELVPDASFSSFSYPLLGPRPGTKRRTSRHFRCCRGGGQTFNAVVADLNLLKAYFLEKSGNSPNRVREIIDLNKGAGGWLIFATHDISETPTDYGCTPAFFEGVVRYAKDSGAWILPVSKALDAISSQKSADV